MDHPSSAPYLFLSTFNNTFFVCARAQKSRLKKKNQYGGTRLSYKLAHSALTSNGAHGVTYTHEVYDEVWNLCRIARKRKVASQLQRLVPLADAVLVVHRLCRHLVPPHRDLHPPACRQGKARHTRGGELTLCMP